MKITKATVLILREGLGTAELSYSDILVKDLAHALIELAQPKLEIAVSDEQIKRFQDEAKKEYMQTKLFTDFDAYVELYTRLKIDAYIRLEHAKQAYNDMVLAYDKLIKSKKENEH